MIVTRTVACWGAQVLRGTQCVVAVFLVVVIIIAVVGE